MKFVLVVILLTGKVFSYGQEVKVQTSINNTVTSDHVRLSETGLYIIPPSSFSFSRQLNGYLTRDSIVLVAKEMIDSTTNENEGIRQPTIENSNYTLREFSPIKVARRSGAYFFFSDTRNSVLGLVFIYGQKKVIISCSGKIGPGMKASIIESFNSVAYVP